MTFESELLESEKLLLGPSAAERRKCEETPTMETKTLGEELPREMARVRDQVMPAYQEIGTAGAFALAMMRADLDAAAKAMAEGDVVAMLRVYESLKGYET